jgi:HAD superfamily hydrolase (TIGR01549 family)
VHIVARLIAGNKPIECELVVFDKDGTLVDYREVDLELARARRKSIEKIGGNAVADLWERAVGVDLKKKTMDFRGPLGTLPAREELLVAAAAFYMKGHPWEEARELAGKAYDDAYEGMKSPYGSVLLEGVVKSLRKMKDHGLKLAIASTYAHRRTVESMKTLRVASLFDMIVGPEDVARGKPSTDMIFEVLKETECRADEAVMVGDSVSDMKMGKNARVKASIGVLTGVDGTKELEKFADVVIDSVASLDVV